MTPGPRPTWYTGRQIATPEGAISGLRMRGMDTVLANATGLACLNRADKCGILITPSGVVEDFRLDAEGAFLLQGRGGGWAGMRTGNTRYVPTPADGLLLLALLGCAKGGNGSQHLLATFRSDPLTQCPEDGPEGGASDSQLHFGTRPPSHEDSVVPQRCQMARHSGLRPMKLPEQGALRSRLFARQPACEPEAIGVRESFEDPACLADFVWIEIRHVPIAFVQQTLG